jgi:hypothetical protein
VYFKFNNKKIAIYKKYDCGLLFGFLEALLSGRADEEVLHIDCQPFALNI